jgi:hypothetical protein
MHENDEEIIARTYQFRVDLAHRNLRRLKALSESGVRDALSLFDDQELEDIESVEREGD